MQKSLVKIRSFQIAAHLNKFFSSSMWRTTKKKKLTKKNTIKLSISSLFSLIQLKIIERRFWKVNFIHSSTSSQRKSTFVTIQRSDFHSFVQLYPHKFIFFQTKQFHSNSKFTTKSSFQTADFTWKYLQFTLLKSHKSSSFRRKKRDAYNQPFTGQIRQFVQFTLQNLSSQLKPKFLTDLHFFRCTIDVLHHFLRSATLNSSQLNLLSFISTIEQFILLLFESLQKFTFPSTKTIEQFTNIYQKLPFDPLKQTQQQLHSKNPFEPTQNHAQTFNLTLPWHSQFD